jgi:hypothetical protein
MNINLQEIKEKYPKCYNKLLNEINQDKVGCKNGVKYIFDTICYCDLEKFFDDNGYRIYYTSDNRYDISKYNEYDILKSIFISEVIDKLIIKQQAILKAFEILEQQIKE